MFSRQSKEKLKTLLIICIISVLAGIIFQYFDDGYIDYNAFMVGILIGLGFGFFELFFVSKINRRIKSYPLLIIILINILLYTLLVFLVSAIGGFIGGALSGRSIEEFHNFLFGINQLYLIVYCIVIFTIMIFVLHINRLLGKGVLPQILFARYHKPVEEERIFMFLDLTRSTEIAEKLTPQEYSSFLKDFFLDIDDAIIETKGTVFQYVGDEVVIIWKVKDGAYNNNCLSLFFKGKEIFQRKAEYYIEKYGTVPEYKAGSHYGKIVITQIGGMKQEIAYHGDTINTTARIRSACREQNCDFLISAELLSVLENVDEEFIIDSVGLANFKGKKNIVGLFSVDKKS